MVRSNLPVFIVPSRKVRERLGARLPDMALLAIRAILTNRRSLEVAHQQIVYFGHHLALSSRISAHGDIVIAIDLGDPRLAGRIVLEDELCRAECIARETGLKAREAERKLRMKSRRW